MYYDNNGEKIESKIFKVGDKPVYFRNCSNCAGTGTWTIYRAEIFGVKKAKCFRCNGDGLHHKVIWHGTQATIESESKGVWEVLERKHFKAYTKEQSDKLIANRNKRYAKAEAKRILEFEVNFFKNWSTRSECAIENIATKKAIINKRYSTTYVGSVGDRIEIDVTFDFKTTLYTQEFYPHNTVQLYSLFDANDTVYTYVGSSFPYLDEMLNDRSWDGYKKGDKLTIKGTVKSHKEYKGAKQNQLQRIKLIKYTKGVV
tara:strand:+ start:87 stop:860 length:774 start_codon:yes stop_codon:yes gene_type:complete